MFDVEGRPGRAVSMEALEDEVKGRVSVVSFTGKENGTGPRLAPADNML